MCEGGRGKCVEVGEGGRGRCMEVVEGVRRWVKVCGGG